MKGYYVSAIGSDVTGDGSQAAPFLTLEKARDVIRGNVREAVTVFIKKGTYFLKSPVVFQPEDSGTEENPIRYCAEKGAVFTGAMPIKPAAWHKTANPQIMVSDLSPMLEIDGLLMNGAPQICARFPNYQEGALPLGSAASAEQVRQRAVGYCKPQGGYIRALHELRWGGNSYLITGGDKSPDSGSALGLSLEWSGDNNRGSQFDKTALVVENVFEELDAPGEWFYDKDEGKLYFYPPSDEWETAEFAAVVSPQLFRFEGSIEPPVHDIHLEGFGIQSTMRALAAIKLPGMEYQPLLRGDWAVVRSGAVLLKGSRRIRISDCSFWNMGGNGIFISGYNSDIHIDHCLFRDTGASCVQVAGLPNAVWGPSFWPHEHFPKLPIHRTTVEHPDCIGPKGEEYPRDIYIEQNHMCNIGVWEKQSSGVNLSVCEDVHILHNTIHKSARSCINVNDGCFGGHEIAFNDIFDSQRETDDHGPFNSWGRDRYWSVPEFNAYGLHGEVVRPFALLDAAKTTCIHNNRFHHEVGKPHTWGIDLDDGSSNYKISDNLCLGLGLKLREGFDRVVTNNIFIGGQFQLHCTYAQAHDCFSRNLIVHSHPIAFAGVEGDGRERIEKGEYSSDKNWFFSFDGTLSMPEFWSALGLDNNSVYGESLGFRNPEANDYTPCCLKAIEAIGFKPFPMDMFGQTGCEAASPIYDIGASKTRQLEIE